MQSCGDRIRELREAKGLKQGELAKLMKVKQPRVSEFERQIDLSTKNIKKVCKALNIEFEDFFIDQQKLQAHYSLSNEMIAFGLAIEKLPPDKQVKCFNHLKTMLPLVLETY